MQQIDVLTVKLGALQKAAEFARTPTRSKTVVQLALRLLEDLLIADRYQEAMQLAATAAQAAEQAHDSALSARTAQIAERTARLAEAYEAVKPSLAVLQQRPTDPEANLVAARFYCLLKGDWRKGLPMFALANGSPVKALAVKELEGRTPAIELADGWWELAEREGGWSTGPLMAHAAAWYRIALPQLADEAKARAEQRIRQAGADGAGLGSG